jgi:hypothetical protein
MGLEATPPAKLMTYGSILRLGDQPLALQELSWKNYTNRVRKNTAGLFRALESEVRRSFFQGITLKSYLQEVIWQGNIKPIKDLMTGGSNLKLGSSLAGVAGLGLLGWDILSNTYQAYQQAKTQEDGTIQSKWKTLHATGMAFLTQAFKSLVTWEVAGLGFAIGKALIPIGTFPVGGILMGALMAAVAYKVINKVFSAPAEQHTQAQGRLG